MKRRLVQVAIALCTVVVLIGGAAVFRYATPKAKADIPGCYGKTGYRTTEPQTIQVLRKYRISQHLVTISVPGPAHRWLSNCDATALAANFENVGRDYINQRIDYNLTATVFSLFIGVDPSKVAVAGFSSLTFAAGANKDKMSNYFFAIAAWIRGVNAQCGNQGIHLYSRTANDNTTLQFYGSACQGQQPQSTPNPPPTPPTSFVHKSGTTFGTMHLLTQDIGPTDPTDTWGDMEGGDQIDLSDLDFLLDDANTDFGIALVPGPDPDGGAACSTDPNNIATTHDDASQQYWADVYVSDDATGITYEHLAYNSDTGDYDIDQGTVTQPCGRQPDPTPTPAPTDTPTSQPQPHPDAGQICVNDTVYQGGGSVMWHVEYLSLRPYDANTTYYLWSYAEYGWNGTQYILTSPASPDSGTNCWNNGTPLPLP